MIEGGAAPPKVGLDGPERTTRLGGDLVEAQFTEEAQGDDLAIWLVQAADRRPDPGGALGPQRGDRGIRAARQVDAGSRLVRIDPGHVAPGLGPTERDPDGDPRQPRPERTVAAPAGEAPEGGHERFLSCVLGLMKVPDDAVAGADDGSRFPLDEDPERVPVTGQDGLDSGAFIEDLGLRGR
jgi:hypothetical protein